MDINNSNKEIINLIKKNEPFFVARLGGEESLITYHYILYNQINLKYLHYQTKTLFNAGIYYDYEDFNKLILYIKTYDTSIKNSDLLASFYSNRLGHIEKYYSEKYNIKQVYSRVLEPFYQVQEGIKPWTHYLKGKKILVINPFVESFKKQLKAKFKIFKDPTKNIFLEDQEFVFYKTYQTIAGNNVHKNWFETYMIMCKDIEKIDFDIALLGCGGYGLPLCNFIKTKLNKSCIYIGGGLQLLFGVMGGRWENIPMWKKIIYENESKFIKPGIEERCDNLKTIEGGCYW